MKKNIALILFLFFSGFMSAQTGDADTLIKVDTITNSGLGLGAIIAVVISWDRNKSILWAIIHGILGWIYVIYYAIIRMIKK
ncbi:hypothetical protein KRE40_00205 [Elizabethkingia meningoseptica]|uniref:hypothetical protein n=1 Tax=Elizabethkingia meningoseptica TaxID=238 RepID=UPI000332C484|nr:hypothetical protein [Elizabethkingia meningoseptica]EOR29206.1 hypothetical protein L100_12393 [Elizabethkingia meningoseptica ATCC 13253 = NBRC 12535]MCL1676038.1 hypothetical protein [Elizabethkingia meningoseptica]MCL1684748.1 hypothetical protein [Elizabethkingia meningoseptica]MDE5437897.1 hypothetical protein [Elizabethkingia meningoseptica]MDE5507070.1 hypothetical protein [Elizabethkingia meningoseptica]